LVRVVCEATEDGSLSEKPSTSPGLVARIVREWDPHLPRSLRLVRSLEGLWRQGEFFPNNRVWCTEVVGAYRVEDVSELARRLATEIGPMGSVWLTLQDGDGERLKQIDVDGDQVSFPPY
jgi:hypothetical protein